MKFLSESLLSDLYNQTETVIEKAIAKWQQVPYQLMNQQPGSGKWSAAQCIEHLNSYGRYYLPAIEKALAASITLPAKDFKSGLLGNYFYKLMLTDSSGKIRKKMAAPKNHQPSANLDAAIVLSEFISQLEKLGQLLIVAKQKNISKVKVPISIAPFIKLKAGDVLLFFMAHIQRHMLQAQSVIEGIKN
jgi:uncharacterized protein (DUF2164 family)